MFSPPRREKARADDPPSLPKGDCRYILLHPEFKGLRCACVGFALNRSIPGSTCDCGHQACYHTPDKDAGVVERRELEALKEKISLLEEELVRERRGDRGALVERLGRLEELVDTNKAETETELKTMYRGIGGLWHNVGLLNKRTPYYDDRIEGLVDDVQRMENRLIEVDDASIRVEERVDTLENSMSIEQPISRRRKASTPPSAVTDNATEDEDRIEASPREGRVPLHLVISHEPAHVQLFRARVASVGSGSQAWTVHVSLLPTLSQPFPFEKDTAAYKRCFSRGLQQMVVIPDSDSVAFRSAVDAAFAEVLQGRLWQPLVARICDAKNLRGLPMLRQLPDYLLSCDYDAEFLRRNCAVVDESGKILDLYIAMSEDTLSWAELKDSSPFKAGLEASWTYDPYLDGPTLESDGSGGPAQDAAEKRPAAGDILPSWSPSLKRNASEISTRTPSFGSATDEEGTRAKMRRQATVEVVGWRAEAV